MSNEPRLVFLSVTRGAPQAGLRVWLTFAAAIAGAMLLALGLVLTLAAGMAATMALLPVWAWRSFAAYRSSAGPATLEGECSVMPPSPMGPGDQSLGRNSTGNAGRPDGPLQ